MADADSGTRADEETGPDVDTTRVQRFARVAFLTVVGLVVLAIAWLVITGLIARHRLESAKTELTELRHEITSGQAGRARPLTADIAAQTSSAHQLTSGPAWWVAANLPGVGTPFRTARTISVQAEHIGQSASSLVDAVGNVQATQHYPAAVDVSKLTVLVERLEATRSTVHTASQRVGATAPSWLPLVSGGRADLLAALGKIDPSLTQADRTAGALVPLIDGTQPRRYFVGFMNEAESRGLGGLPGAFAILTVSRGRFSFTHFGNDPEFHKVQSGVQLGAEYDARYGTADPTNLYVNSDISPDLRDAAAIWAGMWHKVSGQRVDGALMIDPSTLGYLLDVVGPATLPDGTSVSAADVVALTQQGQYAKFSSDARRNAYLTQIASAVAARLTTTVGSHLGAVLQAVDRGVRERRVGVWSADAAQESRIVAAGYGAALQPSSAFTGFTVVNAAGSKLDYYLERRITYSRPSCAAGATATATITLDNNAPRSGLPPYVTFRADDHPANVKPGDNRLLVTYYGSTGSVVESVSVNGQRIIVASSPERGLVATTLDVELPVQTSTVITVTVDEPRPTQPLTVLTQPLVRAPSSVVDRHCGTDR